MTRRSTRAEIRSDDLPTHRGQRVQLPPRLQGEEAIAKWQAAMHAPRAIVTLDLFCGAGGMSLGFEQAGFTIAAGIDASADACCTFAANFLARALNEDIKQIADPAALMEKLGIPRVDVIVGGPPCQGFSIIGRAKLRSLSPATREQIYARNELYREFIRFVAALRPLFFVMENVPALSSYADGVVEAQIREDFGRLGYSVYRNFLEAPYYGVPQSRRRLFFVGSRFGWTFEWPRPAYGSLLPVRTLADAISDLPAVPAPSLVEEMRYEPRGRPDLGVSGEYAALMRSELPPEQQHLLFDHIVRPVRADDVTIFQMMEPGHGYRDVDPRYRRYELRTDPGNGDIHFADRYYKLRWDEPCVAITAHMAKDGYRYIYPDTDQPRTLSVREAARVQSFPDHFRFAGYRTGRFQQIGNAVPPLLARAIAEAVARSIRRFRDGEIVPGEYQLALPHIELAPPAAVETTGD